MVTNIWNKYLPVIKILLKRSKTGEQALQINRSDFEKAGLARKAGTKFNLFFKGGKVDNVVIASPIAADLAATLLQDEGIKTLFSENDYNIAMDTKYQLHLKLVEREGTPQPDALQLNHA